MHCAFIGGTLDLAVLRRPRNPIPPVLRICCARFLSPPPPPIFRFDLRVIDETDKILHEFPPSPPMAPTLQFHRDRRDGKFESYATEFVFSRKVYQELGFVHFDLAWGGLTSAPRLPSPVVTESAPSDQGKFPGAKPGSTLHRTTPIRQCSSGTYGRKSCRFPGHRTGSSHDPWAGTPFDDIRLLGFGQQGRIEGPGVMRNRTTSCMRGSKFLRMLPRPHTLKMFSWSGYSRGQT